MTEQMIEPLDGDAAGIKALMDALAFHEHRLWRKAQRIVRNRPQYGQPVSAVILQEQRMLTMMLEDLLNAKLTRAIRRREEDEEPIFENAGNSP